MAPRVSPCDVAAIMPNAPDKLDGFIITAHYMVEQCYANSASVSEETKKQLELWLSAHLAESVKNNTLTMSKLGDAQESFKTASGLGFESTFFGQQLKLLDPLGCLINKGKAPASWRVLKC